MGTFLPLLSSDVSIHALLAECDIYAAVPSASGWMFQSTHSLRSATFHSRKHHKTLEVSIHALLAECDY